MLSYHYYSGTAYFFLPPIQKARIILFVLPCSTANFCKSYKFLFLIANSINILVPTYIHSVALLMIRIELKINTQSSDLFGKNKNDHIN